MRRLLCVLLLAAASGCTIQEPPRSAAADDVENLDRGDVVLLMEAAPGALGEVEERLREWPLEQIISNLNDWLALPDDITVALASTEDPDDFFFDPEADEIVISHEAIERDRALFEEAGDKDEDAWTAALTTFEFFLYHEIGHALVDILELPITGKEEDAVDGFAALIVVQFLEDGRDLLQTAARFSDALDSSSDDVSDEDFADEHSLDEERLEQFLCWVYGSDDDTYAWIVDDEYLSPAQTRRCADEYEQNVASWETLLGDSLKAA